MSKREAVPKQLKSTISKSLEGHKYAAALQASEKALKLSPRDADLWVNKGIALAKLGRPREAIEAYNKAVALNPNDADAWFNRGLCSRHINAPDVLSIGAESYSKAVALDPKYLDAWENLCNVTFRKKYIE